MRGHATLFFAIIAISPLSYITVSMHNQVIYHALSVAALDLNTLHTLRVIKLLHAWSVLQAM